MGTLGVRMPDPLEHSLPASLPYLRIPEYIPTEGLVAFYPFFKRRGTLLDYSGKGNDGTINGATWVWSADFSKPTLDFDGTDDWIDIGELNMTVPFSRAFWFRTDDLTSDTNQYIMDNDAGNVYNAQLYDGDGDGIIELRVTDSANNPYDSSTEFTDTTIWHHVAIVVTSGTISVFIDGREDANSPFSATTDTPGTWLLGEYGGGGNNYDGEMHEFMFYDRELSAGEISRIYEKMRP